MPHVDDFSCLYYRFAFPQDLSGLLRSLFGSHTARGGMLLETTAPSLFPALTSWSLLSHAGQGSVTAGVSYDQKVL